MMTSFHTIEATHVTSPEGFDITIHSDTSTVAG